MLYIIFGLPRSGTSMLMRMLEATEIEVLTDSVRQPDTDNPKGYYEYEPVKNLPQDASWIKSVDNKGIKVISHLLPYLPADNLYKLLFLLRPIEEILESQKKMLERGGELFDELSQKRLAFKFRDHLYKIRLWIARQPNMNCLFIKYFDVINAPLHCARQISSFLEVECDPHSMASVVDPALYRNRIQQINDATT